MAQLGRLVPLLERRMFVLAIGAVALIAWGLVTFLAVRFAITSARRFESRPRARRRDNFACSRR